MFFSQFFVLRANVVLLLRSQRNVTRNRLVHFLDACRRRRFGAVDPKRTQPDMEFETQVVAPIADDQSAGAEYARVVADGLGGGVNASVDTIENDIREPRKIPNFPGRACTNQFQGCRAE